MEGTICPLCGHARSTLEGPCPNCGGSINAGDEPTKWPHRLPVGAVLQGRYVICDVLGEGGFGITYRGYDHKLDTSVAIKEYFPVGNVTRNVSLSFSVSRVYGSTADYANAIDRFLQEARALARMRDNPVIVNVMDVFEENDTAYIVMEYVRGHTLLRLTKDRGGRIAPQELLPLLEPIVLALRDLHARGLVHRDISPDNILIDSNGAARLIDFGCAREGVDGFVTKRIVLKYDYAPLEQYTQTGQGAWTDVYGLCATIYRCLCGTPVPRAVDRLSNDSLVPPTKMDVSLLPAQEEGLLRGLAVQPEDRTHSISELYDALYRSADGKDGHPVTNEPADVPAALATDGGAPTVVLDDIPAGDGEPADIPDPLPTDGTQTVVIPEVAKDKDRTSNAKPKQRRPLKAPGVIAIAIALLICGVIIFQINNGAGSDVVNEKEATSEVTTAAEDDTKEEVKEKTKEEAKEEEKKTDEKKNTASEPKDEVEGDPNSPFQLNGLSVPNRTEEEHNQLLEKAKDLLPTTNDGDTTVLDFGTFAGAKRFKLRRTDKKDGYTVYVYSLKGDVQDGFDTIMAYYDVLSTCFATLEGDGMSERYVRGGYPYVDYGFNYNGTGKGVHPTSFSLGDSTTSNKKCEILLKVKSAVAKEQMSVRLYVPNGLTLLSTEACSYDWYIDAIDTQKNDAEEQTSDQSTGDQSSSVDQTQSSTGSYDTGGSSGGSSDWGGTYDYDSGSSSGGDWSGDWDSGSSSGGDNWGSDWDSGSGGGDWGSDWDSGSGSTDSWGSDWDG